MLHLRHRLFDPELGLSFEQYELRTKDFIVMRSVHEGGRYDDAIERAVTSRGSEWSTLRFVLGGPILVRLGSLEGAVERGDAVASMDLRAVTERTLTSCNDVLAIAWRAGSSFGPRAPEDGVLRLSPAQQGALSRLAEAIASHDTPTAIAHVREVVAALRSLGIPLVFEKTDLSVPSAIREVGRALERVVFPLSSRPMAIDLARELGVCERQALRRANALFETYYASGSTWREYVHAMRIGLSSFFMSHPRARTQDVSRLLGFSSPTSFCHALHEAGLPSPLELQRVLLAG